MRSHLPAVGAVLICFALMSSQRAVGAIPIEWVTVGDAGNTPGFASGSNVGGVVDVYQMGRTEVTNAQYVEFLNAVDFNRTNKLELYDPDLMTTDARGGILYAGPNGHYGTKLGRANNPVIGITWFDAIRFANWVHNGQPVTDAPVSARTAGAAVVIQMIIPIAHKAALSDVR